VTLNVPPEPMPEPAMPGVSGLGIASMAALQHAGKKRR
jgi:hypothetical protein